MAATIGGAVKAFLEAQGLGISVHRDRAPEDSSLPRVTVLEGVSVVPDQAGDFGSAVEPTATELVQVDVWQHMRDPDSGAVSESYTLVPAVRRALHGAALTASPTHAYGCRVVGSVRLLEPENNIVHTALTVEVRRVL